MAKQHRMVPQHNSERMVPQNGEVQVVEREPQGITLAEVAFQLFLKTYMPNSQYTVEHMAGKAFEDAEAFMEVADLREKSKPKE